MSHFSEELSAAGQTKGGGGVPQLTFIGGGCQALKKRMVVDVVTSVNAAVITHRAVYALKLPPLLL
jgi:hypothetical protein